MKGKPVVTSGTVTQTTTVSLGKGQILHPSHFERVPGNFRLLNLHVNYRD